MQSFPMMTDNIDTVAGTILDSVECIPGGATIIALHGDLGAGKTTLTQAMARQLGVAEPVTSPTFVLRKDYQLEGGRWSQLVHFDMYRIESGAELPPLRFAELVATPRVLVVVEWAERIHAALPEGQTWHYQLSITADTSRQVTPITAATAATISYE